MINCKPVFGILVAGLIAVSATALETVPLLPDGASKELLQNKKPIRAETEGYIPIRFFEAEAIFDEPALLKNVQDAYCELIAEDGEPEFTIEQASTNAYYYINRKGERTDITEVVRRKTAENAYDIIYYSAGKRFFGNYQAVIHVRVEGAGDARCRYVASVYAYPENAVSRFFARRLGMVERFFRNKTREMTGIITTIACSLCEDEGEQAGPIDTEAEQEV